VDIENAGNVDRYAVAKAAETARKPDGNYRRRSIKELAESSNLSERTVRRIVKNQNIPQEPLHLLSHLADSQLVLPNYLEDPEETICVCLALNAGVAKYAHRLAKEQCGFNASYRTFLRRIDNIHPAVRAHAKGGYKSAISNMLYVSNQTPHRNHTWGIDSTQADVRVVPPGSLKPIRPWITVVVDRGTGMMMAVLPAVHAPNATTTSVALTMSANGNMNDSFDEGFVGGLPVVVVFDNGKENLNNTVRDGCMRLNVIAVPTAPRTPWHNGSAERAHLTIKNQFLSLLPGTTVGGENSEGKRRFTPDAGVEVQPGTTTAGGHGLLHFNVFACELEKFRVRFNNTPGSDGLSPMQRWMADKTPLAAIDPRVMLAHMARLDRQRTVNKAGILFKGNYYADDLLAPYRKKLLSVRYLPHVTDWIEVFDGHTYICRAYLSGSLPPEERDAIMLERGRAIKKFRAHERATLRIRNHVAQLMNEGHEIVDASDYTINEPSEVFEVVSEERVLPRLNKAPSRGRARKTGPSPFLESLANEFKRGETA